MPHSSQSLVLKSNQTGYAANTSPVSAGKAAWILRCLLRHFSPEDYVLYLIPHIHHVNTVDSCPTVKLLAFKNNPPPEKSHFDQFKPIHFSSWSQPRFTAWQGKTGAQMWKSRRMLSVVSSAFKADYVVAHSLKAPTETLKNFEETDCRLSQVFLLTEQKSSTAGRITLWTGFHMDIWVSSLGSAAKRGKSTYLCWNQPALPSKISEKSSCFLKAQPSLYSKF